MAEAVRCWARKGEQCLKEGKMWAEEPPLTCWWGGPEHMTCWMELDLLKGEHLCVCRGFSGFHSVLIEHSK